MNIDFAILAAAQEVRDAVDVLNEKMKKAALAGIKIQLCTDGYLKSIDLDGFFVKGADGFYTDPVSVKLSVSA